MTGDPIDADCIARRMSDLACSLMGWLRGGPRVATSGACGMFAGIAVTLGSIMQPEMAKNGCNERFATAAAAAGGTG